MNSLLVYVPWIALFDIGLAPQNYCTYDDLVLVCLCWGVFKENGRHRSSDASIYEKIKIELGY